MPKKTKEEKRIDKLIDVFHTKHGQGVQIDIMDISKIFKAGHDAANKAKETGQLITDAIEQAVIDALTQYRKN